LKKGKTIGDFGKIDKKNSLEKHFSKASVNQKIQKTASLTPATKPSTPLNVESKKTTPVSTPKTLQKESKEEIKKSFCFSVNTPIKEVREESNEINEKPDETKIELVGTIDKIPQNIQTPISDKMEETLTEEVKEKPVNSKELPRLQSLLTRESTFDSSETESKFKNLAPAVEESVYDSFKFNKNKPRVMKRISNTQSTAISNTKTEKREEIEMSPYETGVFTQYAHYERREVENVITQNAYREFDELLNQTHENNLQKNIRTKLNSKDSLDTGISLKRKHHDHLNFVTECVKMGLISEFDEKDCVSPRMSTKTVKLSEDSRSLHEIGVTQWSQ